MFLLVVLDVHYSHGFTQEEALLSAAGVLKDRADCTLVFAQPFLMDSPGDMAFYTNMLTQESPPGTQEWSCENASTNCSQSKTSKKNFTKEEDILLVSAWLNVSMDPIKGNEQKQAAYWNRMCDYFHTHKQFVSDRSSCALSKRWSTMQLMVNKFCGFYAQIENRQQSGITEQDKIFQAMEMYQSITGRPFSYMHCWRILNNAPKWTYKNSKPSIPEASFATPDSMDFVGGDISDSISVGLERPMGRKAAKELSKKGKEKRAIDTSTPMTLKLQEIHDDLKVNSQNRKEELQKIYEQKQKKLLIMEQQNQRQAREEDERVMAMDTTNMDPRRAEYYNQRKNAIMSKVFENNY